MRLCDTESFPKESTVAIQGGEVKEEAGSLQKINEKEATMEEKEKERVEGDKRKITKAERGGQEKWQN